MTRLYKPHRDAVRPAPVRVPRRFIAVAVLVTGMLLGSGDPARGAITVPASSVRVSADQVHEDPWMAQATETSPDAISEVVCGVHQDRRGHLWFATQDGICHHDGTELVYYDVRGEFGASITARAIEEDAEGLLWFGTTGGLVRYDGTSFTVFTKQDGLPSSHVWGLCLDDEGRLWVGTYAGACRLDGTTFTPFPLPPSTRTDPIFGPTSPTTVWGIRQDPSGTMWFVTEGGVYRLDGDTPTRVAVMEEASDTYVTGVFGDRAGRLWFSTRYKGLIRLDGDGFVNVTEREGIAGTEFGGMYEDRAGTLWFSAENVGLYRHDGTSFTLYTNEDGLDGNAIHGAYEDRDGRLWCFGWSGAYRREGDRFVPVTRDGPW